MSYTACFNAPMCGYLATCPDCDGCDDCCRCHESGYCPHGFDDGYVCPECRDEPEDDHMGYDTLEEKRMDREPIK